MEIHIRIEGRVQGVWYRSWAKDQAQKLGLTGFVRNRHDRSVEIYAQGKKEALETFLRLCQDGPRLARVDKISPISGAEGLPQTPVGQFVQLPTA